MTVGELRRMLFGVKDDLDVVLGYDGGIQASGKAKHAKPLFIILIPEPGGRPDFLKPRRRRRKAK